MRYAFRSGLLCFTLLVIACRSPIYSEPTDGGNGAAEPTVAFQFPVVETAAPPVVTTATAPGTTATPTPIYTGPLSPACGQLLPALPPAPPASRLLPPDATALAAVRSLAPEPSRPALDRLAASPATVGLVAYQLGREAEGIYWNAGASFPLASVAKIITLIAYAEAAAAGELNPLETVPLAELERYYLPNFDLGAHRQALVELRREGRILGPEDNLAVRLEDVPWMMIRYSSNAAADYLHQRLGQLRMEETAVAMGLAGATGGHSAPCTFLGQFLVMANHARGTANDRAVLSAYLDDPSGAAAYGRDVALLADAFAGQPSFRAAESAWRQRTRQPSVDTQRYFAEHLAPQGTAGAYAALMARLAQNGLSNGDSSYIARRYLEWPNQFAANQEWASNVGYKNGSLPGVLTTVYYAYRWNDPVPVVVALFFRDLPQQTYRRWRNELPHDELARWLLADPAAIPALAQALAPAASSQQ